MPTLSLPHARASSAPHRPAVRPRVSNHVPRKQPPASRKQPLAAPSLTETGVGLFELFRDAVVVVDLTSGQIVLWNSAAEHMFGYSAAQAIGLQVDVLMPPSVARLHRERLAYFVRTGEAAVLNGRAPLEMPALTRSREEIHVELSLAPLEPTASENQARHVLLMFRDASPARRAQLHALEAAQARSARAETEAKLKTSREVLRDSTREVEASLARVSRAVARLTRLAKRDAATRPQRVALMARVVERRTAAARRTIQQITDAAAIQSATFHLDSARVNLVPLMSRLVASARARSDAHPIRLAAPQGLTALVDEVRLEQVVDDLVLQAVRRNPRGCWIDVDLRRPLAGLARIEVRDYGRRLSARERERLPDGAQTDRSWLLIKHVIQQHQGNMSIEFPAEGGLRATLTLPTNRVPGRA